MAFVNDYLTEDEIEKFRKLNISYGKMICNEDNEVVGTESAYYKEGIRCTLDRDKKMYLFYCNDDQAFGREEFWSPEFFVFIQEKQNELIVTRVGLKRKHFNNYSRQVWSLYSINSKCYKTNIEYDSKNILAYLKEALTTYGFDGDPREIDDERTEFDF
ncbi:MAG: hypothetical protein K6C99_01670 [Lachnospiraceae bacterium]|nr:hypothetical protein [Lachnospiraceae bacterium]